VLEFDATAICCGLAARRRLSWVGREHGIEVDERGFVWDRRTPTMTTHPEVHARRQFVSAARQHRAEQGSNDTTQLGKPRDRDRQGGDEIYVADG